MNQSRQIIKLKKNGFIVLNNMISDDEILAFRKIVIDNLSYFKKTRPSEWSGHLAGFHRFPQFSMLSDFFLKDSIQFFLSLVCKQNIIFCAITDIIVNRSQVWHTDLLRGPYSKFLNEDIIYNNNSGGPYKILCYLQPGKSLKVIPGSHLRAISLKCDSHAVPESETEVYEVKVGSGDIVIMDIRLIHSGNSENFFQHENFKNNPRILFSSVFGAANSMTEKMIKGNKVRLRDWDNKYSVELPK